MPKSGMQAVAACNDRIMDLRIVSILRQQLPAHIGDTFSVLRIHVIQKIQAACRCRARAGKRAKANDEDGSKKSRTRK